MGSLTSVSVWDKSRKRVIRPHSRPAKTRRDQMAQITPALVKRAISRARWHYRRVTCRCRCLPDFIIIGAQKSGTTSLYSYLGQHNELLPSIKKEIHFFCGGLDPA